MIPSTDRIPRIVENKPNYVEVAFNGHTYYFSYKTLIAVRGDYLNVCRENAWGPTTGKHMNLAGFTDKTKRVPGDEFLKQVEALLK